MKKGLIVGINYVGTGNDLKGCINDAHNMQTMLAARGFETEMVLEKDATTAGIKAALARLTAGAVPGDTLFFHYSGHGSQLPSKLEPDGFEEIICPIDLNWTTRVIADKDLKKIFDPVANGVNVTIVLDCCHSGTGLNQDESLCDEDNHADLAARDLTMSLDADADVTPRFMAPPEKIQAKLEDRELVDWTTERDVNKSALLIAGCHADQTSADAYINGTYQGAATAALLKSVGNNPQISYRDLVTEMSAYMVVNRYTQRPQLDGSKQLYSELFLEPFGSVDFAVPVPVVSVAPTPEPVPTPEPEQQAPAPEPEKSNKTTVLIAVIVVIALFVFLTM